MKTIIHAGTDGAALCCFDPAALPADFDARAEQDPEGVCAALQDEQRFWWQDTGGDGSQLVHVYIDEAFPAREGFRLKRIAAFDRFQCPGGTLWVCGAEYAANDPLAGSATTPRGGLGRYSQMGDRVAVLPVERRITVYLCRVTEREKKKVRAEFDRQRGGPAKRSWRTTLATVATAATLLASAVCTLFFVIAVGVTLVQLVRGQGDLGPLLRYVAAVGGCLLVSAGFTWLALLWSASQRGPHVHDAECEFPDYVIEVS